MRTLKREYIEHKNVFEPIIDYIMEQKKDKHYLQRSLENPNLTLSIIKKYEKDIQLGYILYNPYIRPLYNDRLYPLVEDDWSMCNIDFIEKNKLSINFYHIAYNPDLSFEMIDRYFNFDNIYYGYWKTITMTIRLTDKFLERYQNHIYFQLLIWNPSFSIETVNKCFELGLGHRLFLHNVFKNNVDDNFIEALHSIVDIKIFNKILRRYGSLELLKKYNCFDLYNVAKNYNITEEIIHEHIDTLIFCQLGFNPQFTSKLMEKYYHYLNAHYFFYNPSTRIENIKNRSLDYDVTALLENPYLDFDLVYKREISCDIEARRDIIKTIDIQKHIKLYIIKYYIGYD